MTSDVDGWVTCPHCKGIEPPKPEHEAVCVSYDGECICKRSDAPPCRACGGVGRIDELAVAIYRARGGPAPVLLRGFS